MTDDHGEAVPGASGTLEMREGPSRSLVQVLRIADETSTVADPEHPTVSPLIRVMATTPQSACASRVHSAAV